MYKMEDLRGKVAVVTGGASGIGRALAERFLAEGMKVTIADIEETQLARVAQELGCHPVRTDVSDAASVEALADAVVAEHGAVHVVCNNAGIGPFARVADLTMADWQWMIGVNLWGVIHGIQSFLPRLRASDEGGWIVNTASMGGVTTFPGLGAYATCKFGVVALTETLAQELEEDGARVGATALLPGPITSNLGKSLRNRPEALGPLALADNDLQALPQYAKKLPIKPPSVAADAVIQALTQGQLYAVTHPEQFDRIERRATKMAAAFGMAAQFSSLEAQD